jgi:hypothetical protein
MADSANVAIGAAYRQAEILLAKNNLPLADALISKVKKDPFFNPWGVFLEVESLLIKRQFESAGKALGSLDTKNFSNLQRGFKEKLEIELQLMNPNNKKLNLSSYDSRIKKISGFRTLRDEISFLWALLEYRKGKYSECLVKLQRLRIRHPGTAVARKASVLSKDILAKNASLNKLVKTKEYIMREVEALLAAGQGKLAYATLDAGIKRKLLNDRADKQVFNLKLKALKSAGLGDFAQSYLEDLSKSTAPLRYTALSELALYSWNKNDTETLERTLKRLGNSPYAKYLDARVTEERGDLEDAIEKFTWLYKVGGHNFIFATGLRLAWLEINQKSKNAAQTLRRLQKINPGSNYYDTEGIKYWLDKTEGKKPSSSTSYVRDPRLYYYWLNREVSVEAPNKINISTEDLLKISPNNCKVQYTPPVVKNEEYILKVVQFGLQDIIEDELEGALPPRQSDMNSVYSRALYLNKIGATISAIKEIRAFPKTYGQLEQSCLSALFPILFPTPHQEIYKRESARTGVDKYLLMAITRTESTYDPMAVSPVGAQGLMQLMPQTASLEGFTGDKTGAPEMIFSAEENIKLGANHLRRLLDKYDGDWHLVIAGYNAGPQAVDRWIKRYPNTKPEIWVEMINYKETRNYVKKVLGAYWAYKMSDKLNN